MPYNKIELGVTTFGDLLIGAAAVRQARVLDELADSTKVFPSQMQYRCVASDLEQRSSRVWSGIPEWKIMTHRAAKAAGYFIGKSFPVADGRYSIRH